MKAIVVGAGGTTRELLRRLGELWEVVVIDTDEGAFDAAKGIREFERVVGDGSSPLVLKRAGIDQVDALIAATHDDDANLEAVRIAQQIGVLRVVAVAADPERVPEYREVGVSVVVPDSLTARNLEVQLEPRRIASTAFAQGRAEAIEFHISPDSPVRGKRLRDFHSDTWIIAAVLRGGRLIIPHGNTRLEAADRVTVVGAATDFAAIVKTFTSGESRFPLNYGRKVAVILDSQEDLEGPLREAMSLVRNTQAEELVVVHRDLLAERDSAKVEEVRSLLAAAEVQGEGIEITTKPAMGQLGAALAALPAEESIGTIVVASPGGGEIVGRLRVSRLVNAYGGPGVPVLISKGRHPYSGILVPARRTESGEAAGRVAIDIARSSGATLSGVAVVPPAFVSGVDDIDDARRSAAWLREEAAVQGVAVRRRVRRGNPVRVMEELGREASLVVLAMPALPASVFRPGVVGHLIRRVPSSVLLVPGRA